jgi:hypothetical protein
MINIRYLKKPHMNMVNLEASIKLTIVSDACDVPDMQYGDGGGGSPAQLRLCGPGCKSIFYCQICSNT